MSQPKNYITPAGLEKLKQEYHFLHHEERPRIVELVTWAASNGDRSENADYHYGKKRLREIDSRLRFLLKRIELAEVVDPKQVRTDRVVFGCIVEVEDQNGNSLKYQIVGEDEFEIKSHKISWRSPLAQALLNKIEGDVVQVKAPGGMNEMEIVRILSE